MADRASGARAPEDAKLLNLVRTGDTSAFGVLYQRHVEAVRRLARELVGSPAEADHLVAETFGLVHEVTRRGGGPTDAFRPYVLTALRRTAAGRQLPEPGEPFLAPGVAGPDQSRIVAAFLSLPERWRAILWHTQIERETAAELAPILGGPPHGVALLDRRASEGLRQAVLRSYIAALPRPDCGPVAEKLGGYLQDTLPAADKVRVAEHVNQCIDCSALCGELVDAGVALRAQVAPVVLGAAAVPYLAEAGHDDPAGLAAATAAAIQAGPARNTAAGATALQHLREVRKPMWFASAGALAVIGVAFAATLNAGGSPRLPAHHQADAVGPVATSAPASQQPTTTPGRKASSRKPSAKRSTRPAPDPSTSNGVASTPPPPPPSSSPPSSSPSPTTSPSPTPATTMTASVSVFGWRQGESLVFFQVNDTGSGATGALTASITVPAGSITIIDSRHGGGRSGWTCQQAGSGASCQHAAISPGNQDFGSIVVSVSSSACGQPVDITVTSGSVSASGQSSQDIQCGN
ncbi:MAG TPA: sigma-70 family RNA polymerase sigma factor [Streptosporangiaceae bacterium]|nr:sigma-70 family RNA polymerase sigma factor [Streptosporangiaceae bacterium]